MALLGDNLKGALSKAKEVVSNTVQQTTAQAKDYQEKRNQAKAPIEGAIARYEVTYIGGLPEYPKKKTGAIGFNILPTCFVLKPTINTQDWFNDLVIPYDYIYGFEIVKRTVSNTEMLLSSSGSDMKSMEQENNINITYTDENGTEVLLRIEMLTGVSIYGQAGKCREIIDILRQNQIYNKLNKKDSAQNTQPATDPLEQLKKLQQLKEAGVLTDEEFDAKKADLLAKI